MRRLTGISASFSLLKATSAGAFVLAFVVACSDSNGPRVPRDGIPVEVQQVEVIIPDSVKEAESSQFVASLLAPPRAISANAFATPGALFSSAAQGCGSGGGSVYTVATVPFIPESMPIYTPLGGVKNDGFIEDLPLGFNFTFFGNTYTTVNVYANGFLRFGTGFRTTEPDSGYAKGNTIPAAAFPNNIIAFAWADWEPENIPGAVRFETRGNAPDRMFILQFNNVPEWSGKGLLKAQLVLHEGSNAITMYTYTTSTTKIGARTTQGIENANGTVAVVGDSVLLPSGIKTPRVKAVFKLTNDAIRFSLLSSKDEKAPSITPAADTSVGNDPGLASAVVAVAAPAVVDNCSDVTVSSSRSDNAASDAPYPVGVTTITWTATDAAGNFASAAQKITVLDVEAPVFGASARSLAASVEAVTVNATSPSGAVVTYDPAATDNVGVTSLLCEPASGSVFSVGSRTVSCTASDAAGNSASKSFTVSVIGAREQMANLMEYVESRGLPNGTANPLINQLKAAYSEQENECKKVSDFIAMVSKKSSGIDPDDATYMAAEANRILGALGCAPLLNRVR
jgi:hypothetical protein